MDDPMMAGLIMNSKRLNSKKTQHKTEETRTVEALFYKHASSWKQYYCEPEFHEFIDSLFGNIENLYKNRSS